MKLADYVRTIRRLLLKGGFNSILVSCPSKTPTTASHVISSAPTMIKSSLTSL